MSLVVGLLGLLFSAGAAEAAASVTLSPLAAGFPNPIGIDYYQPTNEMVMSVNYSGGQPNNFNLIDSNGNFSQFSSVSGLTDEVYIAAIRSSSCQGGFTPGDMYFGTGQPGVVARLSNGGRTLTDPWVTLPNEGGLIAGGLFQDIYCVAGGDLIVTTRAGDVWRVSSNGAATEVASNFGGSWLEGPTTVPHDSTRYGPWAGQILASDESNGVIWSIDPATGATSRWDGGGAWGRAEAVHVVPPNQNFYGVDFGSSTLRGAEASQFTNVVGDIVLATEFPGKLLDITWNGTSFQSYDLLTSDAVQWEGVTFAPAGITPIPPSSCRSGSPLVTGAAPPPSTGASVEVRAIEVNQVVQDWCDSVPLVAGKPTLVRVHLQSLSPATSGHVSLLLQGARDGVSLGSPLFPVAPGHSGFSTSVNPITVTDSADSVRGHINSTANFWLPASWQRGDVRLAVVGASGSPLACDDPTSSPHACTAEIDFHPSPTLHITLAQGGYPDPTNGHCIYPSRRDLSDSITRLTEIFPVAPGHLDWNLYSKANANSCAQPNPTDKYSYDGSWTTGDFLGAGRAFSHQAHDAWVANGNSDTGRFFATVFKSTTSAWVGTTGTSDHTLAGNSVFYYGWAPPYQDPYNPARYELGHELMHAMKMQHPGPWTDRLGSIHKDTLCETPGESKTASPAVQVSGGSEYAFSPRMQRAHYFDWSPFNTYSDGYAYSLGFMYSGPDQEIYGLNTDAFYWHDLPQRIVVDPHHTFDMMSYCYGTYPRAGASKFQWISAAEYETVLNNLNSY